MSRNLPASIRARLKQHADATKEDFNLTLTHFGLERLLYRLSISRHANNYLLKGALLFSLWYDQPQRPTRDADLLGFGPDDVATAVAVFQEICRIEFEDGIIFKPTSVRAAEIRKEAGYGGIRVDLQATLDGARIVLQVDIGFGDAVTPGPEQISYPVLIGDLPAPQLRAYPKYSVVAEKLHAICLLGMANTRMKDYFDLGLLLSADDLDPDQLRSAVEETFQRRKLDLPSVLPAGLSHEFAGDLAKQKQWAAFLKKNRLDAAGLADTVAVYAKDSRSSEFHKSRMWAIRNRRADSSEIRPPRKTLGAVLTSLRPARWLAVTTGSTRPRPDSATGRYTIFPLSRIDANEGCLELASATPEELAERYRRVVAIQADA